MKECMQEPQEEEKEIEIEVSLNNKDIVNIRETLCMLIAEYMENNVLDYMYPKYHKNIKETILHQLEMLYAPILKGIQNINFNDLVSECILIYFNVFAQNRSYVKFKEIKNKKEVASQLRRISAIPQHEQNTPGWFERRWNLLTASSAWKALGSQAMKNSLIYSKCKPIDKSKYTRVNINSATHHGHKFEPLSTIFYEKMFNTEITEFGCLPDQYSKILGASPDGINSKRNNDRYGYLLEVKNPVSRKLTGIPKLEYWVQMQFQMHVTQLHHCDFLETTFKQYENEENFDADGDFSKTALGKPKGIIVCFHDGNKPVYKYPPWDINKNDYEAWYDNTIDDNNTLTWINNTYWYLSEYSCLTVLYNKKWFECAIPHFEELWDIVIKERKTGYQHRKAKKRARKPPIQSPQTTTMPEMSFGPPLALPPPQMVLKIRTGSFDDFN